MTQVIDPKLYTNDELIKTYHQQKEACRELNKTILNNSLQATSNECDNKIAVVRKLNMVESPDTSPKNSVESLIERKTTSTESLKSLEEKATSEKSEKEIKKDEEEVAASPVPSDTDDALKTPSTDTQKSEVVLRIHPIMQETACQTDETAEAHEPLPIVPNGDLEKPSKLNLWSTPVARKKHPEEVDFENLSKDLASQLSPSDKLHSILGEF